MRIAIKTIGVLFSLTAVALAIQVLINKGDLGSETQMKMSWMMLALCGSLFFNGLSEYLKNKNRRGVYSTGIALVFLVVVLIIRFLG
ncbi:hypothetical protein SAMN04487895_11886 [Paenibacillus sophorae]|uniref:DUF3953 domain-containing protein n=1 Tax=Paenibacillus sophorae TaxID=1333845 RepID=A0A1H8UPG7_9BACL|nr:hypothetical protein [Paenibacillus sophorae]QWU13337.1 hypothetical protein KP014_15125 [Paenibacillus sophorae]SEP05102.1 hypothetical protein SAMN04487895_11886 [Paenibacillus sophorae]